MALDNYADLQTEITEYLDRDDLTQRVPGFIELAEARFKREIRIRETIRRAQVNIKFNDTPDDRYLALPSNFAKMSLLRILTEPKVVTLEELNNTELSKIRQEIRFIPRNFTVHEEIEFDVLPDQQYTAEMIYFAKTIPLSDQFPTNEILREVPDAYLYASLLASAPFLMHDERIATWQTLYNAAREGANRTMFLDSKGGSLTSHISGRTP